MLPQGLKFLLSTIVMALLSLYTACSQGSAGEKAVYETRYIVDMPTAGVVPKGSYSVYGIAFPEGGLMVELSFGLLKNLNLGLSYNAVNIIGSGNVSFQNYPGVHVKYRVIDETLYFPAVVAGVDIQGREKYCQGDRRFTTMSPGVFISLSKALRWDYGVIAIHGGVNFGFEAPAADRKVNFYLGLEQTLMDIASVNFEYNFNTDDHNHIILDEQGTMNASIRFSLIKGLTLEYQLRDLLENYHGSNGFHRCLALEYCGKL